VRCGGNWKRDYGDFYTGTQGETPDTAKESPTDYRASSRPYQVFEFATHKGELIDRGFQRPTSDCYGLGDGFVGSFASHWAALSGWPQSSYIATSFAMVRRVIG
jgi:hypothetical protein